MLEIKRATPHDAHSAFEIRREAIRSQCIGAYSAEQMALWTRGSASGGYVASRLVVASGLARAGLRSSPKT